MKPDREKVAEITEQHQSYLESIADGLLEGILEGAKEGATDGLKKGASDALRECLSKGISNVGAADIKDILSSIPEKVIKASVIEGAKPIFKKSTEVYVKKLCQKLVREIKKNNIKLAKNQTGYVLELIKISEQEAVKQMMARLPDNPFFGAVMSGMQTALEESLAENFTACRKKIQKALGQ